MRARIALPILAVALLAACGTADEPAAAPAAPGALLSKRPLEHLDSGLAGAAASATYVRYESTSPAGKPIEVSGAVFLPKGDAPAGGWPVVAFAHGTSGVANKCAPTNSPTLFGSAPAVEALLAGQRAVVMTNYQGLDGPGDAPYLDTPSSGYDVLDSVRAAHAAGLPLAGDTVLVGVSQGGRAAESAAETAKAYAPELKIHGAVLLSPALELRFLDSAGTLVPLNAPDQYLVLPYVVAAVRYNDPGYRDDQVLHGKLLDIAPALESACTGEVTPDQVAVAAAAGPDAVRFVDADAAQPFADLQSRTNLPKTATTLPVYIGRGNADKLVDTAWSDAAVTDMCTLGTPVHDEVVPGGHSDPALGDRWLTWVSDLFAGNPFASTCPH
ncbi:alpha/beta hydrolase [Nocardia yunnanensis]|uniref:Alpha/beta hydrolase n=1 Tax=Nocardia yunnanensis TaxID=2382165 RepID=A0A386Z9E2_9NOCA|nr:lipase family protein [Nocardia yunnanensis]AYF73857.1 alpha/beta hydrolase [Nocardia yunnanensis]